MGFAFGRGLSYLVEGAVQQFVYCFTELSMVHNLFEALRLAFRSVTDDAIEPLWSRVHIFQMKYWWFEISKKSLGSLREAAVEPFVHFVQGNINVF